MAGHQCWWQGHVLHPQGHQEALAVLRGTRGVVALSSRRQGGSRLCTTELTCQELGWKGAECGDPRSLVLSTRAPWAWQDTPGHPSTLQLISSSTSSPQQPCTELGGAKAVITMETFLMR